MVRCRRSVNELWTPRDIRVMTRDYFCFPSEKAFRLERFACQNIRDASTVVESIGSLFLIYSPCKIHVFANSLSSSFDTPSISKNGSGVPPFFEPVVMRELVVFDSCCASERRP